MQYKYLFSIMLFVLIFTSCTNDSPGDLIENTQIIGQVKYNQNIKCFQKCSRGRRAEGPRAEGRRADIDHYLRQFQVYLALLGTI